MNDEHDEEIMLTVCSIMYVCSVAYVNGDYHLFGPSMPFLRDMFDLWMQGAKIAMPVMCLFYAFRLVRRWLIESVRHSLRP